MHKLKLNTFINPAQGGGVDSTPYLGFLFVKILFIDIFTIPFVRIPEILLAIRKSNKIWRLFWLRRGGRGLFDPKSAKNRTFLDPKNTKFHFLKC